MSGDPAAEFQVGMPRNYLRPALLLLLGEGTSHGYELLEQLTELGLDRPDPGRVYRSLRAMDEDGLVRSEWTPSTTGPARRTYALTSEGRDWLDALAGALAEVSRALGSYQRRYQRLMMQDEPVR